MNRTRPQALPSRGPRFGASSSARLLPMSVHHPIDGRLARRRLRTMSNAYWFVPALAMFPCGWWAAAWHYKRKLLVQEDQIQALRRVAAEHAQQARWQIGQLQAELAARPPLPQAERDRRDNAAAISVIPAAPATAAKADVLSPATVDTAFAATAVLTDGFPQTVVVRRPAARR